MVRSRVALALLALVAFACDDDPTGPRFGFVRLAVQTSGFDTDDGYEITSDTMHITVIANAQSTYQLPEGPRSFELKGVADNCLVDGSSTVSVNITKNDTTVVIFKVGCAATGITVVTQTTGDDVPPYFQLSVPPLQSVLMVPNGTQTYTRVPAGRYQVRLTTGAPNCVINGDSTVGVDVVNRQITPVQFNLQCFFSPRTGSIVFVQWPTSEMIVVNPDGSGAGNLNYGHNPSWSRDGKKIVYDTTQCDYYSYFCTGSLEIVDPLTRQRERLDHAPLGWQPEWSPTDDVIAYLNAATQTLFLYDVATAVSTAVSIPGKLIYHPSWSPDGTQLVAQCWDQTSSSRLCIFNRDGSNLRYITNDPNAYYSQPSWSPDGNQIVFTRSSNGGNSVTLIKPDGSGMRPVVSGWDPSWSPDSKEIIYATQSGIYVTGEAGATTRRITSGTHGTPAWRP